MNTNNDVITDLTSCLNSRTMNFRKGEFIPILTSVKAEIGIIKSGNVSLMKSDIDGNWIEIESFQYPELISKIWTYNEENDLFFVCNSEVEIIFFDYLQLIEGCNPICPRHTEILSFLFHSLIDYVLRLNQKITILQKKNMEDKLMAYFSLISKQTGLKKFEIPISYKELADLLAVDRSALMRKLNDMEEAKKIKRRGRTIFLYAKY